MRDRIQNQSVLIFSLSHQVCYYSDSPKTVWPDLSYLITKMLHILENNIILLQYTVVTRKYNIKKLLIHWQSQLFNCFFHSTCNQFLPIKVGILSSIRIHSTFKRQGDYTTNILLRYYLVSLKFNQFILVSQKTFLHSFTECQEILAFMLKVVLRQQTLRHVSTIIFKHIKPESKYNCTVQNHCHKYQFPPLCIVTVDYF